MILYSLRRKADGKFLSMWYGGYSSEGQWGKSPTFWKKSETIWSHLKKACSQLTAKRVDWVSKDGQFTNWWIDRKWHSFDPRLLVHYEVIETDVNILGERQISAENFVNVEQMETVNV